MRNKNVNILRNCNVRIVIRMADQSIKLNSQMWETYGTINPIVCKNDNLLNHKKSALKSPPIADHLLPNATNYSKTIQTNLLSLSLFARDDFRMFAISLLNTSEKRTNEKQIQRSFLFTFIYFMTGNGMNTQI